MFAAPQVSRDNPDYVRTNLEEVLALFTKGLEPEAPTTHVDQYGATIPARRSDTEGARESAQAEVGNHMIRFPRQRRSGAGEEPVEAYAKRLFDERQPVNRRPREALHRLLKATALLLWFDAKEAAEGLRKREAEAAKQAQALADLRRQAAPPQAEVDRLAAAIEAGVKAEELLVKLPELFEAHRAAKKARSDLSALFAAIPVARAQLGEEAPATPPPTWPAVRLEPDCLRENLQRSALLLEHALR